MTGRAPVPCPRCGASVDGDQSWCLECGLAARTRLARTPNWRAPLVVAGAVGVAAILALVVAFLVLTGDNAPLPTTATAAPAATGALTTTVATTTATTATVPSVPTVPGTTPTIESTLATTATTPTVATIPTVPAP